MTAKNQDFELWQGDDKVLTFTVTDPATGLAKNLNGADNFYWVMQPTVSNPTLRIYKKSEAGTQVPLLSFDLGNVSTGIVKVNLIATDTNALNSGVYYHELQIVFDTTTEVVAVGKVVLHASAL